MGFFTVLPMKNGYRYKLKADNGKHLASSQIFERVEDCLAGIRQACACVEAPVEDQSLHAFPVCPYPKYLLQGDPHTGFTFTLCGPDGTVLMQSKPYTAKHSCQLGILSARRSLADPQIFVQEETS